MNTSDMETIIKTDGCNYEEQLFHNEKITIYHKNLHFDNIKYWKENLRTILAFEVLAESTKKDLESLSTEEVTDFLSKRSELQLGRLAKSIENNGVRVPLIIKDDGTLLDGNRRYFACSLLHLKYTRKNIPLPDVLTRIPVWIVKSKDLNTDRERKILAEANFVKDFKVPWSLDVKAMVVSEMFNELIHDGKLEQEAYIEIENIYSLKKNEAKSFIDTILLTKEYINNAQNDKDRKFKLRESVLKKFVYFWEFRNKGLNGRNALDEEELQEVKPLFFKMIENDRLKNIKQVEPMIKAYREPDLWEMLIETKGVKIDEVVIFYNERKKIKSSEDKVRNFLRWLKIEKEKTFTRATYRLLDDLEHEIQNIKKEL